MLQPGIINITLNKAQNEGDIAAACFMINNSSDVLNF